MDNDKISKVAEEAVRLINDYPTWTIREAVDRAEEIYKGAK